MRNGRRIGIAIGVLVVLAGAAGAMWWYQLTRAAPGPGKQEVTAIVSNGNDRGPGSLREALFVVATAKEPASISIQTPRIALETALPPIVTTHGVKIVSAQPGGVEIDAAALKGNAVFDVAGANTSLEGVTIRNCSGTAILLRAERFRLSASTVEDCDVGIDIAENASESLLERNKFSRNRVGVRFAAATRNTSVVKNEFSGHKDAGLWAVRSTADEASPISVRDNRFSDDRASMVVGNISLLIERNEIVNAREAAIHIVGAGATVRGNRITGGASMGIVAENARSIVVENNELDGLSAYGIMVRGSGNTLIRGNRMHNCGYGMAFVLGAAGEAPSTAVQNTIIQPRFNGIDVVGDSPVLRQNQVLRPHALALHVEDFQPPNGTKVLSRPFLDNNTFGPPDTAVASGKAAPAPKAVIRQ